MSVYECEKYITDKENLKKTLNEFGVAIIPNVLSNEECDSMLGKFGILLKIYLNHGIIQLIEIMKILKEYMIYFAS